MQIDRARFCVNRKIAPALSLGAFFQVVNRCGLRKVEIRNDMPSGHILDGLTPQEFTTLAKKYDIEVVTINALYPFNLPSARAAVTEHATDMLRIAKAIGCQAIIMCTYNEADNRSERTRDADTAESIAYFSELFAPYGIQGLVEPLGFTTSSLRSYRLAGKLIEQVHSPFNLVLDTFHHHLAGLPIDPYAQTVAVEQIGLVHLSGVEDNRPTAQLTDEERIMLSPRDVLQSKAQVHALEALGYQGSYAFEPFSSVLNHWGAAEIEQAINQSIAYICD